MHILNQFFDRIYVITVHTFTERHEQTKKQLDGIDFEWILSPPSQSLAPRQKITTSEASAILGQASAICNARLHNYKRVAIWEDDGVLNATEDEMKQFFDAIPEKWDFLYMGNSDWADGIWKAKIRPYSAHVNQVLWGNGASFMGVNSHIYSEIIAALLRFGQAADFKYNNIATRGNTYGPKKYFSVSNSVPHEKVRRHFTPEQLETYIPSYIVHSL